MGNTSKLTNMQAEMLKLFSYDLSEEQLSEIKELLAAYFAKNATKEMDKLWASQNLSNDTMKEWSQEHMRTPYEE